MNIDSDVITFAVPLRLRASLAFIAHLSSQRAFGFSFIKIASKGHLFISAGGAR